MTDHEKIKQAVRLFLEGIGEDISREGLRETPERIARMCEELYGGMDQDASAHLAKTFNVESSGMVIEKDITFYSTCEHHILPFYGKAHIAYIPDGKVVGLSKLARTVLAETSTLGVRVRRCRRYVLTPSVRTVDTAYGPMAVKRGEGHGICKEKPEYRDVARAAREQGLPFGQVWEDVAQAAAKTKEGTRHE